MISPYNLQIPIDKGYEHQQIAFSGGRSSGYLLLKMIEENDGLPDSCVVSFQNTSRENIETLDFVARMEEHTGQRIEWLEFECLAEGCDEFDPPPAEPKRGDYRELAIGSDYHKAVQEWFNRPLQMPGFKVVDRETCHSNGEVFDMLIRAEQCLPNKLMRFCTRIMKAEACNWNMEENHGAENGYASAIGIRSDEPRRAFHQRDQKHGKWKKGDSKEWSSMSKSSNYYPMFHAGVTKQDIDEFWRMRPGLDLELPLVDGKTIGGNCKGCFNKSEWELFHYVDSNPDDAWKWLCREHWIKKKQPKDESDMFNSFNSSRTMKGIFEFLPKIEEFNLDIDGVGCQADGGECSIDFEDDDAHLMEVSMIDRLRKSIREAKKQDKKQKKQVQNPYIVKK